MALFSFDAYSFEKNIDIIIYASECVYSSLRSVYSLWLVPRNYDPTLHPFEVSREYTRALNATKLDRVFAKPFLASLDGHRDGVNCMAKHSKSLSTLLSGSCDGEVTICQKYKYITSACNVIC